MGEARSVPQTSIEKLFSFIGDATSTGKEYLNENLGLPFVDTGIGFGDVMVGEGPELLQEMGWGKSPFEKTGHGYKLDPRVADVADMAGMTGLLAGPAKSFVKGGLQDLMRTPPRAQAQGGYILGEYSKGADKGALVIAKAMKAAGLATDDEIFEATKWYKDEGSGDWMYEVAHGDEKYHPRYDDPDFDPSEELLYTDRVSNSVAAREHPDAIRNLLFDHNTPAETGSFMKGLPGSGDFPGIPPSISVGRSPLKPNKEKAIFEHETQHFLSNQNKFATGGNQEEMRMEVLSRLDDKRNSLLESILGHKSTGDITPQMKAEYENLNYLIDRYEKYDSLDAQQEIWDLYDLLKDEQIANLVPTRSHMSQAEMDADPFYKHLRKEDQLIMRDAPHGTLLNPGNIDKFLRDKDLLKDNFRPNYVHGRAMDYGTDDIDQPLMMMSKEGNWNAQDLYSGAAWGDSAPANFPFRFDAERPLMVDDDKAVTNISKILDDIGKGDWMDSYGNLTEKGEDAIISFKRSKDDVIQPIDLAYIPDFRDAAQKRGFDSIAMDRDFAAGDGTLHNTVVPLNFDNVTAIGGQLSELLRKGKYGASESSPRPTRRSRLRAPDVNKIDSLLQDTDLTLGDIAKTTGYNRETIFQVSKGVHPLQKRGIAKFSGPHDRSHHVGGRPATGKNPKPRVSDEDRVKRAWLTPEEVDEVDFLVRDPSTSLSDIARTTGHNKQTVSTIARGVHPLQKKGLAKFSGPYDRPNFGGRPKSKITPSEPQAKVRKQKVHLTPEEVNELDYLIQDHTLSLSEIARLTGYDKVAILNISKGVNPLQKKGLARFTGPYDRPTFRGRPIGQD